MEKIKNHTEKVKIKAKQAHTWANLSRRNMIIAVSLCFVALGTSAAAIYYTAAQVAYNPAANTPNSNNNSPVASNSDQTDNGSNSDSSADNNSTSPAVSPQNSSAPSVILAIDNVSNGGTFAKNTPNGAKNATVHMDLGVHDIDIKNCTVTDNITLDDDSLTQTSKSIAAVASQDLSLIDGKHSITVSCKVGNNNSTASQTVIIMDNQPKKCKDFSFSEAATTATTPEEMQNGMVGTWQGCVTTPWVPKYFVTITFRNNGNYSAKSGEQLDFRDMNAMYYGTEDDNASKKFSINNVQSGVGSGNIVIWFGNSGTTTNDDLKNVKLMGNKLSFEILHLKQYGPLTFQLNRQ
jgi:hypothetical protein